MKFTWNAIATFSTNIELYFCLQRWKPWRSCSRIFILTTCSKKIIIDNTLLTKIQLHKNILNWPDRHHLICKWMGVWNESCLKYTLNVIAAFFINRELHFCLQRWKTKVLLWDIYFNHFLYEDNNRYFSDLQYVIFTWPNKLSHQWRSLKLGIIYNFCF